MSAVQSTDEPFARLSGTETGEVRKPRIAGRLTGIFCRWRERRSQSRTIDELQELDDRTLKDIGLRRSDIVWTVRDGARQRRFGGAGIGTGTGAAFAENASRRRQNAKP